MQCCSTQKTIRRMFNWHKWLRMTMDTLPHLSQRHALQVKEPKLKPNQELEAGEKTLHRQKDLQIWCGCWKMLEGAKGSCMPHTFCVQDFLNGAPIPGSSWGDEEEPDKALWSWRLWGTLHSLKPLGPRNHNSCAPTCADRIQDLLMNSNHAIFVIHDKKDFHASWFARKS